MTHEFFSIGQPSQRPGLGYQHLYDLCAIEAARAMDARGTVLIVASNAHHAGELLSRVHHGHTSAQDVRLIPVGGWFSPAAHPLPAWVKVSGLDHADVRGDGSCVIWAEPSAEDATAVMRSLVALLRPQARVCVMIAGSLSLRLAERQTGVLAERPLGWGATRRLLERSWQVAPSAKAPSARLVIAAQVGVNSPVSTFWALAASTLERAGRLALADRCHFHMRRTLVAPQWATTLSAVGLVTAVYSA